MSDDARAPFVKIPPESLSPEALDGLITEFVSRDGTDYGFREATLEEKSQAVRRQLARGDVVITFDVETESCNIVAKEALR